MSLTRKYTWVLSILICLLVASVSFYQYYGQPYDFPLILNSKFKYYTRDPQTNLTSPYLWEVVYYGGGSDVTYIQRDNVNNVTCMGLHVIQDGVNDTNVWATIHVKQTIGGQRLVRLLNSTMGIWVYPTFPYIYDKETKNPQNVFGVEINDGVHIIWFIFSENPIEAYTLKNHHFEVIQTPLNQWSYREIDIKRIYEEKGWPLPDGISFIIILGAARSSKGDFACFVKEIVIKEQGSAEP